MKRTSALLCALILGGLSAIHVYWARGGTAFADAAVPTRSSTSSRAGQPLFEAGREATLAVAVGLALAAVAVLRAGFTRRGNGAARLVWLLFTARAIGDFRYVGFTKKVKDTEFAKRDTRIYSPLCIAVASLAQRASK